MKQKELWINQIKGLCICLVVIYHSVITFYPHLTTFQHPLSEVLSKCWIYFNLGNDSNLLIVFYVQIMPDDFVMQLHRF